MKNLIIVLFCSCFVSVSFAQSIERQVIGSQGSSFVGNTFTYSQTVGEVATSTTSNSSFKIIQGFQLTYTNTTGIIEKIALDFDAKIYPNPVANYLNIEMNSDQSIMIRIEIRDLMGRLIQRNVNPFSVNGYYKKTLDLSFLSSGNYIVSLWNKNKIIGSASLVKD